MASVTFPTSLGGDGSTVTDDANPSTGLANGGHRTRFVPALSQMVVCMEGGISDAQAEVANAAAQVALAADQVDLAEAQVALATTQANNAAGSASAAAASAASAVNSPGTNATSTSSVAIGTGSKTLTVQTGKNFVLGQPVMIARTSAPGTTWMAGNITAYNSGTGSLTVNVVWIAGSGTFTDWTISLAAPANPAAVNRAGDTMTGNLTVPSFTNTGLNDTRETTVIISGNTTAQKSRTYVLTASVTLTLPATPTAGDWVRISNRSAAFDAVVARNGSNIMGLAEDMTIDIDTASFVLIFADATRGWIVA